MAVVFSYPGATTFTALRDPAMGNYGTLRMEKSPMLRSGKNIFFSDRSIQRDIKTLTWKYMHPTDLANLLVFLAAVGWTGNPFDATMPDGTVFSVLYHGPQSLRWIPSDISPLDFTIELLIFGGGHLTDESGNRITDEDENHLIIDA